MMNAQNPAALAPTTSSRPAVEEQESHAERKFGELKVVAWPAFRFKDYNPYQFLLYSQMQQMGATVTDATPRTILRQRYDVFHVHWPDHLFLSPSFGITALKTVAFLAVICLLKLRGTKIVWTVHNLVSHEHGHPFLIRALWRWLPSLLDGFITMTDEAAPATRRTFPGLQKKPCAMIPHGHYRGYYKDDLSRAEAREKLGVPPNAKGILFFGMIRPYKNLTRLIQAFGEIEGDDVMLIVAGDLPEHQRNTTGASEIHQAAAGDGRIILHARHIDDDDIQIYFKACDVVVLPYASVLNSGAAILALSFDRPVLLPNIGAMPELQKVAGEEWVHLYTGDLRAEDIERCLASTGQRLSNSPALDALDWSSIAASTYDFFLDLSSPNRKPADR